MAKCTRCPGNAGIGHRICLQCLASWAQMRFVALDYLKTRIKIPSMGPEIQTASDFMEAELKRLHTKYKKTPLLFRDLVEWDDLPTDQANRIYRAVNKKNDGNAARIVEERAYLKELWHSDRLCYQETIAEIESIYGKD